MDNPTLSSPVSPNPIFETPQQPDSKDKIETQAFGRSAQKSENQLPTTKMKEYDNAYRHQRTTEREEKNISERQSRSLTLEKDRKKTYPKSRSRSRSPISSSTSSTLKTAGSELVKAKDLNDPKRISAFVAYLEKTQVFNGIIPDLQKVRPPRLPGRIQTIR